MLPITPLQSILAKYRGTSQSEREKGSYFRYEVSYADLYSDVWLFTDWAKAHGFTAKDAGIDLVASTCRDGEEDAYQYWLLLQGRIPLPPEHSLEADQAGDYCKVSTRSKIVGEKPPF